MRGTPVAACSAAEGDARGHLQLRRGWVGSRNHLGKGVLRREARVELEVAELPPGIGQEGS